MTEIRCADCGQLHDISHIEPSLRRPDLILQVPEELRGIETIEEKDSCVLAPKPRKILGAPFLSRKVAPQYFLRVLMPFRVEGRERPCSWSIWVEISGHHFYRAAELWTDPNQSLEPPFPGRLANDLRGYPPTTGLAGSVQLQNPTSVPVYTLDQSEHPLVDQQRQGVTEATVLQWLQPFLHQE